MPMYEYIKLEVFGEPTKEEVQEALKEGNWDLYISQWDDLEYVAEDILEAKHSDWEIYDEDEVAYLILRKLGEKAFKVVAVNVYWILRTSGNTIFTQDDFLEEEIM